MKIPKYYLNRKLEIGEQVYEAWIEIRPIEDYLVPDHRKEELEEARKYSINKIKMCIIGTKWIPIPESYITERI